MYFRSLRLSLVLGFAGAALGGLALADWNNSGGNPQRNGISGELGPDAANLLWSGGRTSVIAWQPVIEGDRVFVVRQTGFPPGGEPNGSPVVAMNLDTGAELWAVNVPFNTGDWTTWIAGARDGRVYASRSGNGASVAAKMYALDASDGDVVWISADTTRAGAYDGVVFADNGDLIVADNVNITRIRALDGSTAWRVSRLGSVSGNCGAAVYGDAVYIVDAAPGGHKVYRHDLATGAREYGGPLMPGFTIQNTPMVGPDGAIYVSRTQNNVSVDFFYAFHDDGAQLSQSWSVPAAWTTGSEFAVGPDGSVYMMAPGYKIARLDPADGSTIVESAAITSISAPRMSVDVHGRLFLSNGNFSTGRFYSFNPDLTERWSVAVQNINIGAPAFGRDGTLVICGINSNIRAYRTARTCREDIDGNGVVDSQDLAFLLAAFGTHPFLPGWDADADIDADGRVDAQDLALLLALFGSNCP